MKILIENGRIIDGSGGPMFPGRLSIHYDRIVEVGEVSESAASFDRVIDAKNAYIAPGFVDLHSHTDLANFLPQGLRPKISQGVTTEVIGQCGLGVAPMPKAQQTGWRQHLVIGNPPISWTWEGMGEYLSALEHHGLESNLVPFVGHGTLRYAVREDRSGPLNSDELQQLCSFAEESFRAGIVGLSFGLIYIPAVFSNRRELQRLLEVVSHHRGMISVHLRSESDEILEAIKEVVTLIDQFPCRLHISHLKTIGRRNWGKIDEVLRLIEKCDLSFDCYPYYAGSTTLLALLPPFVLEGNGIDEIVKKLRAPAIRQRIKNIFRGTEAVPTGLAWDNIPFLAGWENILITDMPGTDYQHMLGRSVAELASEQGKDPAEVAMDLIVAARGAVRMIDYYEDEETLRKILSHPHGMFGTDSLLGGKVHPRVFGSYPKILHEYVFEQRLLSLEEAIAKMTGRPASLLGLRQRGFLRPGYAADLVIFDETFRDLATFDKPEQPPEGLRYVLINGEVKMNRDVYSTNYPGRLLTAHEAC